MRRAILILAAMAAFSAAAVAAGCGGGSSSSSDNTPLTKAAFIAKADGICAEANKNQPKLPPELAGVDPTGASVTDDQLDKFGDYIDDIVKLFRSELADLHGVTPPAALQTDYDKALAALEEALNELDDAGKAAHDHNKSEFKDKLAESDTHSNEANQLAKKIGLKVCGST